MSTDHTFSIYGHPNIYNDYSARKLNIYFSEPDKGVKEDTGIVLLIPGFGANANSNVYKKMRSVFADKYNLIAVQCDYFGWEFMQSQALSESRANFNDMGIMQALDNITAVTALEQIIINNALRYNSGKMIIYGHSHGAYLAYLCNIFAPDLFSMIIDNSAWLYPVYIDYSRQLYSADGSVTTFDYFAREVIEDREILNLKSIYKKYNNTCSILSFHGAHDNLISLSKKQEFCDLISSCELHQVHNGNLNDIFKSSGHGLNADFLLMFDYVMKKHNKEFAFKEASDVTNQNIETNMFSYVVDYTHKLPFLTLQKRHGLN